MNNWDIFNGRMRCLNNFTTKGISINKTYIGSVILLSEFNNVSQDSWISKDTIHFHSRVKNQSLIDCKSLNNCEISNALLSLKDIQLKDWYIENKMILAWRDLFTWIDDEHIIFKNEGKSIQFDKKKRVILNIAYNLNNNHTYIGKINYHGNLDIVWNCTTQKTSSEWVIITDYINGIS